MSVGLRALIKAILIIVTSLSVLKPLLRITIMGGWMLGAIEVGSLNNRVPTFADGFDTGLKVPNALLVAFNSRCSLRAVTESDHRYDGSE